MKTFNRWPAALVVCLVTTFAVAQANRSFEADPAGAAPSSWTVTGGTATVSATADDLFPSDGSKYLVLSSIGTGPAVAGHGPHAAGTCGQVTQVMMRPGGTYCSFQIDWEFLPDEDLPNANYNDFLSIDIVNALNNVLIGNVVYIDTGAGGGVPPYTDVPGAGAGVLTWVPDQSSAFNPSGLQAPAGFKRAWVDLTNVVPGTPLRIEISVCNGGDAGLPSVAYIDNVRMWAADRNSTNARMRVLSSAHADGVGTSTDWGGDLRPAAPYLMRTCPGQRLALRASSAVLGAHWILAAGNLVNPAATQPFGQISVDVFSGAPYVFPINGFSTDPFTQYLGTLASGTSYYDVQIPADTPLGTSVTIQGAMDIGGGSIDLTAATVIDVGAPQIPVGGALIAGGANQDDSFTFLNFAAFGAGSWPYYGVAFPSVVAGSNGILSFGLGAPGAAESESAMLTGVGRIAAVWDDLDPTIGAGDVRQTQTATTFTVSWTGVAEKGSTIGGNNFAVQMYQATGPTPAGVFTIYYGSTTMDDGLAGISPGGLPAPGPGVVSSVDLSATTYSFGSRGTILPGSARFERFAQSDITGLLRDSLDLMTLGGGPSRITFVPDGAGGYTFFTGTR